MIELETLKKYEKLNENNKYLKNTKEENNSIKNSIFYCCFFTLFLSFIGSIVLKYLSWQNFFDNDAIGIYSFLPLFFGAFSFELGGAVLSLFIEKDELLLNKKINNSTYRMLKHGKGSVNPLEWILNAILFAGIVILIPFLISIISSIISKGHLIIIYELTMIINFLFLKSIIDLFMLKNKLRKESKKIVVAKFNQNIANEIQNIEKQLEKELNTIEKIDYLTAVAKERKEYNQLSKIIKSIKDKVLKEQGFNSEIEYLKAKAFKDVKINNL